MIDFITIAGHLDAISALLRNVMPGPVLGPRHINPVGTALVKRWEGLVLVATPDMTGLLTIGYGHTRSVSPGDTVTAIQAEQLLLDDLAPIEAVIDANCTSTDNQFSAMVSLAFNIGTTGFLGSTVLREHKANNFLAAADAFLLWDKAHVDGRLVVVQGLLNRRRAEQALYLTP